MHCNGKCYLEKQLKEQERQGQQAPYSIREKFEVSPFFLPKQFSFAAMQFLHKTEYHYTADIINPVCLRSVFRPPNV